MKNIDGKLEFSFCVENIRKRPAMYIGSKYERGVYALIHELTWDVIYSSNKADILIKIEIVENDTIIFMCDSFINESIVLEIVIALSDICELNWGNRSYIFKKGLFVSETNIVNNQNSFKIMFRPDKEIFLYKKLDYYMIFKRLKELAQLNGNVKILITDNENKNILQFHNGLEVMLYENIYDFGLDCPPLNINFVKEGIEVSVSMLLGHPVDVAISYVNDSKTHGGGSHVQGLYDGVYYSFKKYIKKFIDGNIKFTKKDIIDLNFVINVRKNNPSYKGNTKRIMSDNETKITVKNGVIESLDKILKLDQSFFDSSSIIRSAAMMHVFKLALKQNNPDIDWFHDE